MLPLQNTVMVGRESCESFLPFSRRTQAMSHTILSMLFYTACASFAESQAADLFDRLLQGGGPTPAENPATLANAALSALDSIQQATFMQCTDRSTGEKFLFSKVLVPKVPANAFAPALTPQGAPPPGSVGGYYQFALFRNQQGHYISKISQVPLGVSDSDRRNKIDARYKIDLSAQSYRIYNVATSSWSQWTNAGSFGNDVHYGSFTVFRRGGQWVVDGSYLINTNGQLQAAPCAEMPRG